MRAGKETPMRALFLLMTWLPLVTARAAAQDAEPGWQLRLGAAWQGFSGGATDNVSGVEVTLRPSNTLAFELGLARRWKDWELRLDAGYADARFLGESEDVAITDKSTQSTRVRGAMTLARAIASPGANRLQLELSPALDYWDTDGVGSHAVLGGRLGVGFLVPLGSFMLENSASVGLSPSPFAKQDIPPSGKTKTLITLAVGAALRYRF
jgi:hypothetical protein